MQEITEEDAIDFVQTWMLSPGYPKRDYSVERKQNTIVIKISNNWFDDTFIIGLSHGVTLWCPTNPLGYKVGSELFVFLQSRGYELPVYFPVQKQEREPDGYYKDGETHLVKDIPKETIALLKTIGAQAFWFSPISPVSSKGDAVEFAEWLQYQEYSYRGRKENGVYKNKSDWKPCSQGHVFLDDPTKTTEDLYQLFLNNKQ